MMWSNYVKKNNNIYNIDLFTFMFEITYFFYYIRDEM